MRTVFDNDMVAHVWAQQSQSEGRSNSMSFRDTMLFSYAAIIGRFVTHKGKTCVLLSTRSWSVTTSAHQSRAASAVRHISPIFQVIDLGEKYGRGPSVLQNLKNYAERIINAGKALERSRKYKNLLAEELQRLVAEANAYAEFFGSKRRFSSDMDFAQLLAEEKRQATREEKKRKREQERLKQQEQGAVEAWLAGENVIFPYIWRNDNVRLRVKGDVLETSLGAQVPLEHCRRVLALIRSGQTYKHNGHTIHVGHFRIDEVDENGTVKAGCHTIQKEEIERVAALLGW